MSILNANTVRTFYSAREKLIAHFLEKLGTSPDYETNKAARAEFFAIAESIGKTKGTASKDWSLILNAAGIVPLTKGGAVPRANATGKASTDSATGEAPKKSAGEAAGYGPLIQWMRKTATALNRSGKDGASGNIIALLNDAMREDGAIE